MIKIKHVSVLTAFQICFIFFGCTSENKTDKLNPYNLDITQSKEEYEKDVKQNPDMKLEDLGKITNIYLDIRYATTNNFTGKIIYYRREHSQESLCLKLCRKYRILSPIT